MTVARVIRTGFGIALILAGWGACRAEDLWSVYQEALGRDPAFQAARFEYAGAEQRLPQARAGVLPSVSAVAGESRQRGDAAFGDGPEAWREVRSRNWSLQLTQPVFRPAAWAAYRQADAQWRQAAAQFETARQELLLRVAQAYFDVLSAEEARMVAGSQAEAVAQQWTLARRNFDAGITTITDVHEARSRLDLARSQRIAADNEWMAKQAELERLLGRPVTRLAGLAADALPPAPEPAALADWLARAAEQYPLVAWHAAQVEVQERELERQRSGHWPTVDVNASYGNAYASGSMTSPSELASRSRTTLVGVQMNLPLWSGGAVAARVAEARAQVDKARAELEAARRQAVMLARQAHAGVVNGRAQIEALAAAVTSSREALEANRVGYRIGTRINIDVLNAEQQWSAARRDLARLKLETLLQGLRLRAAVGALDEADLAAVNRLLVEPESPLAAESRPAGS